MNDRPSRYVNIKSSTFTVELLEPRLALSATPDIAAESVTVDTGRLPADGLPILRHRPKRYRAQMNRDSPTGRSSLTGPRITFHLLRTVG